MSDNQNDNDDSSGSRWFPPAPAVPLTDEQIRSIYSKTLNQSLREQDTSIVLQFARAIEQAYGIGGGK